MTKLAVSRIAAKFQVTVPPEVRRAYGLKEGDFLDWTLRTNATGEHWLVVIPTRPSAITPDLDAVGRLAEEGNSMKVEEFKAQLKSMNAPAVVSAD